MKQGRSLWVFGAAPAAVVAAGMTVTPAMGQGRPLMLADEPVESVYAPPMPPKPEEGVNEGGVHVDLTVNYMTDYVYRGIEILEPPGSEDAPNLQFDGRLSFDLGKLPHPFVGVFANVNDSDPLSRFQEIRPFFGLDWTIKPFTFTAGNNTYIYQDRSELDTSDVYAQVKFDDSILWRSERPVLAPYIYAAYDYDLYDGAYIEAGLSHDFLIKDFGITLTAYGHVAYVIGDQQFGTVQNGKVRDSGFQHYQIGLIGKYSLNALFNIPRRYGEWSFLGYLNYTDGLNHDLRAANQVWGGAGIGLEY